jgi:hypothetical protein
VTIFEALRDDHERQRDLIARLVGTEGDSVERRRIFDELKVELHAHAGAEERFFYNPLMEHDLTQDKARHSVAEHKELDDFVEQLDEYDMSAPQWLVTAKELAHRLTHHLDEEEHEVFQVAGKALKETEKDELGASYQGDMARRRAET